MTVTPENEASLFPASSLAIPYPLEPVTVRPVTVTERTSSARRRPSRPAPVIDPPDIGEGLRVVSAVSRMPSRAGPLMAGEVMLTPRPPVTAMPSTPGRLMASDESDTPPSELRSVTFTPVRGGAEHVRPVIATLPRVMSTQPPPVSSRRPVPPITTWAPASADTARLGVFTAKSP